MGEIGQEKKRLGGSSGDGVWGSGGCPMTAVPVALEPKENEDSDDSGGEWKKRDYDGLTGGEMLIDKDLELEVEHE
ncbi:hypothetical protein ACOSP7_024784 [Xanthoceras sorbifolium]